MHNNNKRKKITVKERQQGYKVLLKERSVPEDLFE